MAKPPRRPGKPARSGRTRLGVGTGAGPALANPWARVIADVEAALIKEAMERAKPVPAASDAELLADCATVERANQRPVTVTAEEFEHALVCAGVRRPNTIAGWRAKIDLALFMIEVCREPDQAPDDYERMLPWLVLSEVLTLFKTLEKLGTLPIK